MKVSHRPCCEQGKVYIDFHFDSLKAAVAFFRNCGAIHLQEKWLCTIENRVTLLSTTA